MIIGKTKMLELSRNVLTEATIKEVAHMEGATPYLYSILDRWALNSPEKLKALENKSKLAVIVRLAEQWTLEEETMAKEEYYDMELQGMSSWEIFKTMGVNTEL